VHPDPSAPRTREAAAVLQDVTKVRVSPERADGNAVELVVERAALLRLLARFRGHHSLCIPARHRA
jgi:hypothetical protein